MRAARICYGIDTLQQYMEEEEEEVEEGKHSATYGLSVKKSLAAFPGPEYICMYIRISWALFVFTLRALATSRAQETEAASARVCCRGCQPTTKRGISHGKKAPRQTKKGGLSLLSPFLLNSLFPSVPRPACYARPNDTHETVRTSAERKVGRLTTTNDREKRKPSQRDSVDNEGKRLKSRLARAEALTDRANARLKSQRIFAERGEQAARN